MTMRFPDSLSLVIILLHAGVAHASIWERAAAAGGVPARKLYAIALQETGQLSADGKVRPWPWTVNCNAPCPAGARRFASKSAAYRAIRAYLRAGHTSLDVGLMQINLRSHWQRVRGQDLLDPAINTRIGAEILAEGLRDSGGRMDEAVARYHSRRRESGQRYAQSVADFESRVPPSL